MLYNVYAENEFMKFKSSKNKIDNFKDWLKCMMEVVREEINESIYFLRTIKISSSENSIQAKSYT